MNSNSNLEDETTLKKTTFEEIFISYKNDRQAFISNNNTIKSSNIKQNFLFNEITPTDFKINLKNKDD